MKLLGVLVLLLSVYVHTGNAFFPWYHRPCIDCYGRPVGVNQHYFDGCNYCVCNSYFPPRASCTLMWCQWNRCFKRGS